MSDRKKQCWHFLFRSFFGFFGFFLFGLYLPSASAALNFSTADGENVFYLEQENNKIFSSDDTGLSGAYEVVAELVTPANGEVDEVTINGVSVPDGGGQIEFFAAYDFTTSGGILDIPVEPVADKYGISELTITIDPSGVSQSVTVEIDTRLSEDINIESGQQYGKDPYGGLLDFDPPGKAGVAVSDSRVTGLIWSENFGWIDLQPPGGGVTNVTVSPTRAELDGFAWNDNIGRIDFGKIDGSGGVYLDIDGYFHGTAWSENFGYFSFGDHMALDPTEDNAGATAIAQDDWAKTSWTFANLYAPTIDLVAPADTESSFLDRSIEFTFHIEDQDVWNKVGYIININKKNSSGGWSSYEFETHPADLDVNDPADSADTHSHTFADNLTPGEYRWQMRAFDEGGKWSEFTDYWTFTIPNAKPTVVLETPLSPSDGDTVEAPTYIDPPFEYGGVAFPTSSLRKPIFQFTITEPDEEPVQYRVEISDQSDFSRLLSQSSLISGYVSPTSTGTTYSYIPVNRLPAKTLYWRVSAADVYGAVPDSTEEWSFEILNEPPTLTGVSLRDDADAVIIDGGTTNDTVPELQWTSGDVDGINMQTYIEVYLQGDTAGVDAPIWNNAGSPFIHNTGFQKRSIGPLDAGDYFYRIQTCDPDGSCTGVIPGTDDWQTAEFTIAPLTRFGNIGTAGVVVLHSDAMIDPAVHEPDAIDPTEVDGNVEGDGIDSTDNKFAWNETAGWIDMNPTGGGVLVNNDRLQGYAWNDAVGWIRMNCNASDPDFGIIMTDECGTYSYGVTNSNGVLLGKAFIETTGNYLYFDEATYSADHGGADWSAAGVNDTTISCDTNYEGHFKGWAYSPDIGWVAYGREALVDPSLNPPATNDEAADYFSMTEWDCGNGNGPELKSDNIYTVFSARSEDFSFQIANKNPDPYSGDIACGAGSDTDIDIEKMFADGSIDLGVNLTIGTDFEVDCLNPTDPNYPAAESYDGSIWLTLTDNGAYKLTQNPGLYRITGDVADDEGEVTPFPNQGDVAHDFVADAANPGSNPNDEYIIQIVASMPDMTHSDAIQRVKFEQSTSDPIIDLVADGDDTMRLDFDLLDSFGNQITDVYKYEDISASQIKDIEEMRVVFRDQVTLDQVESLSSPKDAVTFLTGLKKDTSVGAEFDGGYPSVQYADSTSDPHIANVDIVSIAPTNPQNSLSINRIEAKVIPLLGDEEYNGPRNAEGIMELGQTDECDTDGDGNQDDCLAGVMSYSPSPPTIDFNPMIEGTVGDLEASFGAAAIDGTYSSVIIELENKSNTKTVSAYDWMGLIRSVASGTDLQGLTTFESTYINYNGTESEKNDFWVETSTGSPFIDGFPSLFSGLFPIYLSAVEDLFITDDDTLPNNIPPENSITFDFYAKPVGVQPDETTQFFHHIAIQDPNGSGKIIKLPLQFDFSEENSSRVLLSIAGSTHGEQYDPGKIVGETDDNSEFTQVGQVYDRQEIRKIMYENYRDITGLKTPEYLLPRGVGVDESIEIDNWTAFSGLMSATNNRALQDGKVVWFERYIDPDNSTVQSESLTVTLGDDSWDTSDDIPAPWNSPLVIPPNLGPVTLLVRGGNVYIRDDIFVGRGTNLGIIALSSRENSTVGTEGNIIIGPEVTHLEGVFYADGSVLMAKDANDDAIISEDEIFDGFDIDTPLEEEFVNQLFIKGSVVSQNTAGILLKDGSLPVDTWVPNECASYAPNSRTECGGSDKLESAAMRYDFTFMRLFRLGYVYNDEDGDDIGNQADCDYDETIGTCERVDTGIACDTDVDGACYNTVCELKDPVRKDPSAPVECDRTIVERLVPNDGRCAVGTPWCQDPRQKGPFEIICGSDPDDLCDEDGVLVNKKIEAAIVIEFDPKVRQITPVGMNLPPIVNFN